MDDPKLAQFYIAPKSPPADERTRVLKYGKMFAVFDRAGDIELTGLGERGIFFEGTRFLSEFALTIGHHRPLLLSSTIREDNAVFAADLANIDLICKGEVTIPRGTVHVTRLKTLWRGVCYEQLRVVSYALYPLSIPIAIQFNADFADLFEVRGTRRQHRGQDLRPEIGSDFVILSYLGLDGVCRHTTIRFTPAPDVISERSCVFHLSLQPKEMTILHLVTSCHVQSTSNGIASFDRALEAIASEMKADGDAGCYVHSSNEPFNISLRRSASDVAMMTVGNPETSYPYAGVPWFSTVFGRDGIITALQCLWMNPQIAHGVLQYLAKTQAREVNAEADAEPGKIIHEERSGEMAALKEIPFGRYYGSVDSTPLFIMLAGAYYQRTADLEFIQSLWPNIESALHWLSHYGDCDQDGFVEYQGHSPRGLVQQGWKDSSDSVFHADGTIAEPPIALCEVQGYAYAAMQAASRLATALGNVDKAEQLARTAIDLRAKFEEQFWCPELDMYALALDGRKQPCRVRASNSGHCLYSGIAGLERAGKVAHALLAPDFFSGWGIRTVSVNETRYNPVSYHNGSVWPHDNAIIALGASSYGFRDVAARILSTFIDVSSAVELHRLPELFCGLDRRFGEGPTLYPVACAPQAWAAGALFMMLEGCLGISIDAPGGRLILEQPCLPPSISQLWIRRLRIGKASVDLFFERRDNAVRVEILEKRGDIEVIVRWPR